MGSGVVRTLICCHLLQFHLSGKTELFSLLISHLRNYQITHLPNFLMDLKNLPPAMISQLVTMVEDYINNSQKKYAPQAVPLTDAQRNVMQPFFPAAALDAARLCVLRGTRVSNPSMYPMAKMMGIRNLPDFSEMEAHYLCGRYCFSPGIHGRTALP